MKGKIISILFALVLVVSFSLVTAVPAAAIKPPPPPAEPDAVVFPFELGGKADSNYVAEWSDAQIHDGSSSVYLATIGGTVGVTGDEARILIDLSLSGMPEGEELTLGDIETISWYEYLVAGYPPHLDISLDFDGDGVRDDILVFEYAYNTEAHAAEGGPTYGALTNGWYETFSDDDAGTTVIDDSANAWLGSGPPGPLGDTSFIYGTLADWKAGTVDSSVDANTVILAFEIEVDNWIVQTEAYVDDIVVNDMPIFGQIQDAIDSVGDNSFIYVLAGTYTEDVTVNMNLTLVGAQFGVDPRGGRAGDESEIVGVVEVTSAATNVAFAGFKFTSPTRAFTPRGFNLHIESQSSTISNNIFVAEANEGHTYSGYLDFEGITNATVIQNSFSGHLDLTQTPNVIRLGITGAGIVTVADNEMRDVGGGGGIGVMCGNASAVVNIDGNVIENTGNECIWVANWLSPGYSTFATLSITSNYLSEATLNGIKFVAPITGVVSVSDDNEFWDNPVQVLDSAEILDIQGVLDTNIFDRAVVIDREGGSLLHIIWSSIQDGIEAAQTDDTVNVADGTYTEDLTIGVEGLTLQAGSSPVLKGTIDVLNGADDVTIDGFNIQPTSGWAVDVWQAGNVTVTRCTILGLGAGGDVDGIAYRHSAPTEPGTVTDNELTDCDLGIMIDHDNAGTFTVTGNTVVDNRKAISIGSLSDAAIEDNPIISGSTQIGVEVFGTGTVSGNVFQDNAIQVVDVNENLNIEDVLANNTFDRAVTVDHLGASLLHTIWSSIQDGVDAATGGDTVKVAAGIYKEHITIDKSNLRLMGEDKQTTIIDATQDSSWPIAKPGILIGEYPLIDGVHGVTVSGFTIRDAAMQEGSVAYEGEKYGVGPQALAGILIYNSSSNTIENNILINNYWQIFLCAEWPAAGYTECMNNRIANNIIQNSENDGVYLYSDGGVFVQDTEIIENEISNAYGEFASGVEFWGWPEGGDTPTISSTVIKRNLITGCTYGVRIRKDVSDITGTSINLNNFITNTNYGVYNGVASTVDATRNWWGHPTGPSRELPHGKHGKGVGKWVGKGDRVSDNVDYMPWLRKSKEKIVPTKKPAYARHVVLDKTGEYGWNTFSTPIFLDDEADTWKELYKLTDLDYSLAYRFDSDTQEFVHLPKTDEYAINPGEGFFIKMDDVGSLSILYSTEVKLIPPSRGLKAGWNLIGLANLEDMDVKDAFASIATAPGLAGYSQVVSPIGNVRPGPVLADGKIYVGESYWVYMLGARTLAGFTMTPVDWVP